MSRSLTMQWAVSNYIVGTHDGIRVRITITCNEDMESEVFAYRQLPYDPSTGELAGYFSHICSPVDLAEYPRNRVAAESSMPWFRLPFIDVLLRSTDEAAEFVSLVQSDLIRLKRSLDNLATLTSTTTVTVGTGCTEDEESTESSDSDTVEGSLALAEYAMAAAAHAIVFDSQGLWEVVGDGADSDTETPASLARITLQPGTASHVLQISGFDVSTIPDAAIITGISAIVSIRDATTDSEDSSSLEYAYPPVLSAIRAYAAGVESGNLLSGDVEIPSVWVNAVSDVAEDATSFVDLTGAELKSRRLILIIVVYVPLTGRVSQIEVDGASVVVYTKTEV